MVTVSRTTGRGGSLRRVGRWARKALAAAAVDAELSVVLCDDLFIRELNATWREKDAPTDVLSFPQDGAVGPLLGDVVISTDTARRQAAGLGHGLDEELQVLLVHGICHLLGHDHHTTEETTAMRAAESRLLAAIEAGVDGMVARAVPAPPAGSG